MFKILRDILNEMLITEAASVNDVNSAIDNHERVIINYHTNGEDANTGARVIEVYAYGLTKAGNPVIRAFQPYGDTTTKVPNWKFFRLDRITAWKPTGQIFDRPADFYYKGLGEFNPNGDDTMSVVYKIIDFNNNSSQHTQNGPLTKQSEEPYQTDTEHRMQRLRQQLNNPIKLSDIKDKNGFRTYDTVPTGPQTKDLKPKEDDIYKTDTERGMERLRQQLEKPKYIQDINPSVKQKELNDLRKKLGDTTGPITVKDLNNRLAQKPEETVPVSQTQQTPNEDDVYKTDTERNMDKLKQQLNNPQYIDLSRFKKRR